MKYLVLVAIALLTGCATTNSPMTAENAQKLTGESLIVTKRESPSFIAMTSSKGMFAVLGVAAAVSAGNEMVKTNNVEDPAFYIADAMAKKLTDQHAMAYAGQMEKTLTADEAAGVAKELPGYSYAVDVTSTGWSFIYDGFNFSDYYLRYGAEFHLIDIGSGTAIAEGNCSYNSKEEVGTVKYEDMMANDAAYIKEQLKAAADNCIGQFSENLLSL